MPDREAAVPCNLQHAMQTAEDGGSGLWVDLHPPTDWHDCPECGTRLYGRSLFHTNDDILVVTYSCLHDDCLVRWIRETAPDELYYQGETEVVDMGEQDSNE
jgi:hypothetical protein